MTCNRIQAGLDALLDGELDDTSAQALEHHAAHCADCGRALERARALAAALRALSVPEPRAGFFAEALRNAERRAEREARRGWRRVHALTGLGGVLAAGLVAVALTGFWPTAPRDSGLGLSVVSMSVSESRTVNLVFASQSALDDVSLTVELPPGVELQGREGETALTWRTALKAGNNVLALPLVAVGAGGGPLVAALRIGEERRQFVVTIDIS